MRVGRSAPLAWRDFFALVRLLRVPMLASGFAALVYLLPDQSLDSYVSIAQNIRLARPWAHVDDWPRVATAVVLLVTLAAVAILSSSLWLVSNLLLASRNREEANPLTAVFRRWVLPSVVALPAIGLTFGVLRAALQVPAERLLSAMMAAQDVPPDLARDITQNAFDATVIYIFTGTAAALALSIISAVLWAERRHHNIIEGCDGHLHERDQPYLLVALCLTGVVLLAAWQVPLAQILGSGALFALFVTAIALIGAWIDRRSRLAGIPVFALLLIWALALAAVGMNDNHQVRLGSKVETPEPSSLEEAFGQWYASRTDKQRYVDRGLKYPVYIVAAQGGGIYAAYHAAVFLAAMQDECPLFRKHLFAISSVSGGSVGAAVFHALLKGEPVQDAKCSTDRPPTLSDRAGKILRSDLLAPLVAAFLGQDFLQRLFPVAIPALDRARALERALERSMNWYQPTGKNWLSLRMSEHWTAKSDEPALLMGTTEVETGRLRVLSPFPFPSKEIRSFDRMVYERMAISTGAVLSARFPWITPAGWYEEQQKRPERSHILKIRLVDGGIFENSGVAIALEVIRSLEKMKITNEIDLNLIVLTDGAGATDTFPRLDFGEILDPVRALLSARSARAPLMIAQAERELDGKVKPEYAEFSIYPTRVRRVPLESLGVRLPLGWHLSHSAMLMIDAQTGDPTKCIPVAGYKQGKQGRFEADCVAELIFHELNGTLLERLKSVNDASSPK